MPATPVTFSARNLESSSVTDTESCLSVPWRIPHDFEYTVRVVQNRYNFVCMCVRERGREGGGKEGGGGERETQIKSQKLPGKVLVLSPVLQLPGCIPVPCVVHSPLQSSLPGCTPPDAHLASAAPRRCSQASLSWLYLSLLFYVHESLAWIHVCTPPACLCKQKVTGC